MIADETNALIKEALSVTPKMMAAPGVATLAGHAAIPKDV